MKISFTIKNVTVAIPNKEGKLNIGELSFSTECTPAEFNGYTQVVGEVLETLKTL